MRTAAKEQRLMTVEEYFEFESKSKIRHEYMDGEIFAMSGARRNHSLISSNIGGELYGQLKNRDCEVHYGDLRVRARGSHYVFGDVVVACGELQLEVYKDIEILLNPTVVFEVLSKSTEARDRGEKAQDYRRLPSLQEYILVSQKEILVEHFTRQRNGSWQLIEYREPHEKIVLASINCELLLADVYNGVKFPQLKLVKPTSKD